MPDINCFFFFAEPELEPPKHSTQSQGLFTFPKSSKIFLAPHLCFQILDFGNRRMQPTTTTTNRQRVDPAPDQYRRQMTRATAEDVEDAADVMSVYCPFYDGQRSNGIVDVGQSLI